VWAYLAYRNDTDGVFVNAAVLGYALLAMLLVTVVDRLVRRRRDRRLANPS
jgi:hypothetical protein